MEKVRPECHRHDALSYRADGGSGGGRTKLTDSIQDMTFNDITKNAQNNVVGFKTIIKLLTDSRFYK